MTMCTKLLTAAAVMGSLAAAPALAQTPYPYPQPAQPSYGYAPQPGYGQGYGYNQQNNLGQIIGQLLGSRYSVTDRTAVQQCAGAAMSQASAQYQPRNAYRQSSGYNHGYGSNGGYSPASTMRVTAITNVERRRNGLRVSGLLDSQAGYPPHGQAYGYHSQGHAATGDLSFRCNVDDRGAVSDVRVRRNTTAYRR